MQAISYKSSTSIPKISNQSIGRQSKNHCKVKALNLRSCLYLLSKYTRGIIAMAATITSLIRASTVLQLLFISAMMWLTTAAPTVAPTVPTATNGDIALGQFKGGMEVLQRVHVSTSVLVCYLLPYNRSFLQVNIYFVLPSYNRPSLIVKMQT